MPTPLIQKLINTSAADQATYTDAVSRIRVCEPESLIDTDFEYGLQNVKWETIQLVNNIPTFFTRVGDATIPVTAVTSYGSEYIKVTTSSAHNLSEGAPFYIVGLRSPVAEGFFNVIKVVNSTNFTYRAKSTVTAGSIFDANASLLYPSQMYAGTSFTSDQIQYITTDSNLYSTLNVVTNTISGFTSNTNFALTNSVGQRQLTFLGQAVNGTTEIISITNHNLAENTAITFSNISGANTTGLVENTTYYVSGTSYAVSSFRVSATPGGAALGLNAGTTGAVHAFVTNDDASDDIYNTLVSSEATAFQLFSSNQILPNIIQFNPSNVVNQGAETLIFSTPHRQASGNPGD